VEDQEIAEMLTTPKQIRTLQRKLYRKAKSEPTYRFYSLYDKVYRADILSHAYNLVKANKGKAGIDSVTFKDIEEKEGITVFLAELERALKLKIYRPSPVRRVMIPKADGSKRPLGIPTIRDRVVQMAVKLVIEPIFEADFCENSYGFRPKRSAHNALDNIHYALNTGYTKVIDADLSKYFDTIPHSKLMIVIAKRIIDGEILGLIQNWLKAPIIEEGVDGKKRYVGGGKDNRKGTPQGGVISPLLSNIYLHILDSVLEKRQKSLGAKLIRYADDFVVLCKWDTQKPMELVEYIIDRLGLTLNQDKTSIVDTYQDSFSFLGFELCRMKGRKTGKYFTHIQPSKRSLKNVKDRITLLTRRELRVLPLDCIIEPVNSTIRGWVNYFHYGNSTKRFKQLRRHTELRMHTHLRKRHCIRDRGAGYNRFTDRMLYESYNLYKVPTTAGWTKAHALR
jgi:group II intron reverse transcriptase/maturase